MEQVLAEAPAELTNRRLRRIGEGIGRVVYASDHWVVKRERSPHEVVALILLWRLLRRMERLIPGSLGKKLLQAPARQLKYLRLVIQAVMLIIPRSIWFSSHIRSVWRIYHKRNVRGARLAEERLSGTSLVPDQVEFPPTRVKVGGWPGWLIVCQAEERAQTTLHALITDLARQQRYSEVELWLNRFLNVRQSGWQHGLFSVDAHLKNFGVSGDRIFLIDTGGLTDKWSEIESRLSYEERDRQPHVRLGLEEALAERPDLTERFNERWKATVNREVVEHHWPD